MPDPQIPDAVVDAAQAAADRHVFADPTTCRCGYEPETVVHWQRHILYAALAAAGGRGWRYEPDALRAAADDLTALYVQAMRDGEEHDGIDPYATAGDVVVWLRARADGQVIFDV